MERINSGVAGRRALRVGGALGLALMVFIAAAVAYNEWDEARGGGGPDWLIVALPSLAAAAALVGALRLPTGRWSWLTLAFGACLLGGGLLGAALAISGHVGGVPVSVPLLLLIGAIVAGPSVAAMTPWWNRTDEAARQAHLSGFFWGATAGAITVLPVIMAAYLQPESMPAISAMTPGEAFFAGAMTLYGGITVGYVLFWGRWWLARSGGGE